MKHLLSIDEMDGWKLVCTCGWNHGVRGMAFDDVTKLAERHTEIRHQVRAGVTASGPAEIYLFCKCGWSRQGQGNNVSVEQLRELEAFHMAEHEGGGA